MLDLFSGFCFLQIHCLYCIISTSALMFPPHSSAKMASLDSTDTLPTVPTKIQQAFCLTLPLYFAYKMVNNLSIPIEPPTAGIWCWQNIPIRLSYLPPPEIEPNSVVLSVKTISQITPVQQSSPLAKERSNETFLILFMAVKQVNSFCISVKVYLSLSPYLGKALLEISSLRRVRGSPLKLVSLPMISHCYWVTPFVISSACTSCQVCLSSLSTEEQIVLNMFYEQPASPTTAYRIFLWLTLTKNSSTDKASRISCMIPSTSASGIMGSYLPAISKSHWQNSLYLPLAMVGWSLLQTLPMWNLLIFWMLVLLAMNRAKGTVRSYLNEHFYPP